MGQTERFAELPDAAGRSAAGTDAERSALSKFVENENGATAIEYAMIASLISVLIVVAVTQIGTTLTGFFNNLAAYV